MDPSETSPNPEAASTVTADPQPYTYDELIAWPREEIESLERARLKETPSVDLAHYLEPLEVEERRSVLRKLPRQQASNVLAEMEEGAAAETFSAMREARAVSLMEDLDPDDAADVFGEMEALDRDRLLQRMDPEDAATLRELLTYDPETAGGVMTPEVAMVHDDMTVDQAIARIRELQDEWEDVYYIYVIDREGRLKGIVSMRGLILARPYEKIRDIMSVDLKGVVDPETDREDVARIMADLNLMALPVADKDGRLLGMVTHDDVIDILRQEATEDLQKLVGAGGDENVFDPMKYAILRRNPWLQVNLLTAFAASGIVYLFQNQIAQLTLLAVFLPIFASMGGNSGAQTLAVVIRGLALNQISWVSGRRIIFKELVMGLANGFAVGLTFALFAFFLTPESARGPIVFIVVASMVLTMGIAGLAGALIPLLLKQLRLDPAQSSSIFLTTVTDIAGFFIFLSLGAWLML